MEFTNVDRKVSSDEVSAVEAELNLTFPKALRSLFLEHNGGEPEPYVFQEEGLYTVVNETLPLVSEERGTAVRSYQLLVLEREIVGKNFFPFAVDAGGDYFFVDCEMPNASVYFYRSDRPENPLLNLNLSLEEFWECLQPEE